MSPNTRKKNSVHEYLAQLVMDYDYRTNDEGVLLASLMIGNDESDITPESKSVSISPEKADTPDKADHDTSPNGTVRYFMQSNAQSHNSAASASVSATPHSTTAATTTITGALQHSTTSTSSTSFTSSQRTAWPTSATCTPTSPTCPQLPNQLPTTMRWWRSIRKQQ